MCLSQNKEWIPIQIKVFSRWISNKLKESKFNQINDISKDLKNGVNLVELSKVLTNNEAHEKYIKEPKTSEEMIQNCDLAMKIFANDGVNIENITGKDINENDEKKILQFIWTLISHYSIKKLFKNENIKSNSDFTSIKNCQNSLLKWANDRISNYPYIKGFTPYFMAMCALLDSYFPNKINYYLLDPKETDHAGKLAISVMEELEIPVYIETSDIKNNENKIDEKILLTQLASAKKILEKFNKKLIDDSDNIVSEEQESKQSSLSTDTDSSATETDEELVLKPKSSIFVPKTITEDNKQYEGKKFGLIIRINETSFNSGEAMIGNENNNLLGGYVELALTLTHDKKHFLNQEGFKLDLNEPNFENDDFQIFMFGEGELNTVITSVGKCGMAWDVANNDNINPPPGTPFYLSPFHGGHNQHFIYKDGMIYATQNGMVVTYIGGEIPLQMMPPKQTLESRQKFYINLI